MNAGCSKPTGSNTTVTGCEATDHLSCWAPTTARLAAVIQLALNLHLPAHAGVKPNALENCRGPGRREWVDVCAASLRYRRGTVAAGPSSTRSPATNRAAGSRLVKLFRVRTVVRSLEVDHPTVTPGRGVTPGSARDGAGWTKPFRAVQNCW